MWHYNRRGETSSPIIVLKTRRSLRAVHFHPHAAPFLLTAEVTIVGGTILPYAISFSMFRLVGSNIVLICRSMTLTHQILQ